MTLWVRMNVSGFTAYVSNSDLDIKYKHRKQIPVYKNNAATAIYKYLKPLDKITKLSGKKKNAMIADTKRNKDEMPTNKTELFEKKSLCNLAV